MPKPTKVINNYVYIVLEHETETTSARVHGVYTTRDIAKRKLISLYVKESKHRKVGYLSVLKKPVQGPEAKVNLKDSFKHLFNEWKCE